jgi:hypothetical protein
MKRFVRICLIAGAVGAGCVFGYSEFKRQNTFWKKIPAALPRLLAVCSTAKIDPNVRLSSIRPMVLPIFRPKSDKNGWEPKDFALRFIGDLYDDRQAFDPDTIQTVVVVDWEWRTKTGSEAKYEVWDAAIIDISTATITAQQHFDVPPDLISKDPQIAFGRWINSFPLVQGSSGSAHPARHMPTYMVVALACLSTTVFIYVLGWTFKKPVRTSSAAGSLDELLARIQQSKRELTEEDSRLFTNAVGVVTAAVFGWPPGATPPVVKNPEGTLARFLDLPKEQIIQAQRNVKNKGAFGRGLDLVPPSEKYAEELARTPLSQWDEDRADALSRLLTEHENCEHSERKAEIRKIAHDIGTSAYDNGWIFRMMLVYKRTGHLLGRTPPGLESMWDGIGSWAS